ncbi:hypothetical protein CPC08DRAFT_533335 [Agrocybe pediades]|nr:hypothetical protein CPC08DRAFT_533335 [Agrocybe pediades]
MSYPLFSYKSPFNIPPLINTSPPDFQIHDSYVEDNPYPYWTADSDDSVSAPLPTSPYPHKIYDTHLPYGTTGVLADYSYPQGSLPISPSTETGNEYVAQPTNPSDPYSRHIRPPRPVPPRHASEASMEDNLRDAHSNNYPLMGPSMGLVYYSAPLCPHLSSRHRRHSRNSSSFAHRLGATENNRQLSDFSGIAMPTNRLLPHAPSRLLTDWKMYREDDFGDIPATAPPLSSMTIGLPMPSSGKWSSSVSSSAVRHAALSRRRKKVSQIHTAHESGGKISMPKYGAYPTEVLMGRQTHDAVIPPPLVVPPFDHGPGSPMDNSLHSSSDSAGVRRTRCSATDDRFFANWKRIDGSSSPREDNTGKTSMLQEEQSMHLHLPPHLRGDTIGEGSQNRLRFCDPSLVDATHAYCEYCDTA